MKLRKFFGKTSRSVLEQVRTELGDDALILENRATPDGIEVTALPGAAFDRLLTDGAPVAPSAPAAATALSVLSSRSGPPHTEPALAALAVAPLQMATRGAAPAGIPSVAAAMPSAGVAAPAARAPDAAAPEGLPSRLATEVASLRAMLEQQLGQFAWSDTIRRAPLRAQMVRDLLRVGFAADLARSLAKALPEGLQGAEASSWLTQAIAARIRCVDPADDIVARGGVYALTGATGVGKTTTAAKLAARCAVRHGAASLALLTTDTYRVGAHDQLRIYARILGVSVQSVNNAEDLRQALDSLSGRHLVIVDTLGMGQRDARVQEHAVILSQPHVQRLVVLAATAQAETLDEVVDAYRPAADGSEQGFAGAILTKLDEAARLGDALDVLIRKRLCLHYLSTGQRVPEDLHAPNVAYLVNRAMRAAVKCRAAALDDDEVGSMLGMGTGGAHG